MKVAVVSGARSLQPGGLELAERSLLRALQAADADIKLDVRVTGGRSGRLYAKSIGARWYPTRPQRIPHRAWRSADVIHLLGLDLPPSHSRPFVVSMYDLASLHFPDETPLPDWTADIVDRAARIITSTQFGASEIHEHLGVDRAKIRVVPLGPGHAASRKGELLSEQELASLGLRRPFVLRMGGYTQRKNVPLLLDAWPEVRKRTGATLAMVGPPHAARDAQLAAAKSLDGIVPLEYVPAKLLAALMQSATALVWPSIYEGFGLPPLEAMGVGLPVVAVRSPTVEEVCGDAAVLVENDRHALAHGLVTILEDGALRESLVIAGHRRAASFNWETTAASVIAVYREL